MDERNLAELYASSQYFVNVSSQKSSFHLYRCMNIKAIKIFNGDN